MNGDVRPSAYGLNVFAQKPQSIYDAKQLPVDTGAFASIGLSQKRKLLDVHLDVEKTAKKAHEIDVTGATAERDELVLQGRYIDDKISISPWLCLSCVDGENCFKIYGVAAHSTSEWLLIKSFLERRTV